MKRIILFIVMTLALTGLTQAQQQFANNSFESWDTIGDYTQPGSWYSLNSLTQFGLPQTADITADAHTGNYAVVLESKAGGGNTVISGVLCTGPILDAGFNPDFEHMKVPYSGHPSGLKFYYKSWPQPGDTGVIGVALTRWNASQQKTDTVADANFFFTDTVDTYTMASITFDYYSPLPADSAFLIISSSLDGFNPTEGSKLQIDDIELLYATGLNEVNKLNLNIYPNPVNNLMTIDVDQRTTATAEVFDQAGRKMISAEINRYNRNIDLSGLHNGIYFISLQDQNGATQRTKLIVQH